MNLPVATDESPLTVQAGELLCFRLFDVADEIDLNKAEQLLTKDARRLRLTREGSEYLLLPNPPLAVELGKRELPLRRGTLTVQVTARLFDHGAASIILSVPVVPGTTLTQLIPVADELYDSREVDRLCLELVEALREQTVGALEDSHVWEQTEGYTVIFIQRFDRPVQADELVARPELPRLLLGELGDRPLSTAERADVLEHRFSYTAEDLVVVDWNSAFVYEPSGSRDIPDLLEICNAQLLELRYYDDVLDRELKVIYDEVQERRRGPLSILHSPYRRLVRRMLRTLVELSEFIERVENTLKIVGDFYLAKVYEGGVKRLRIRAWHISVTRKQKVLAETYTLLKGDVDTSRSLTLEATIVILIVSEIFMAMLRVVE